MIQRVKNMNDELDRKHHFHLEEDFYALTYLSYMKGNAEKYDLSP